jgi:AAA domain
LERASHGDGFSSARWRYLVHGHIILIGPVGAGKSTLGALLAEALRVPRVSMDAVRWAYYDEIGYDRALAERIARERGFGGLYRYWKPFELHAVERLLAEHRDCGRACVIDFGAGHSVYEDEALFERAARALAPFSNVVLVLPCPDPDEAVRVLHARGGGKPADDEFDVAEHFVKHPSNRTLAKVTVYTNDRTPAQTRDEMLSLSGRETRPKSAP